MKEARTTARSPGFPAPTARAAFKVGSLELDTLLGYGAEVKHSQPPHVPGIQGASRLVCSFSEKKKIVLVWHSVA